MISDILGLDSSMFQEMSGGYGYKRQYFYNDIKVYFEGKPDMGIHVLLSGNGIRFLEIVPNFEWKSFFFMLQNWFNAKITRLDIAVDDKEGLLNLLEFEERMKNGEIVSRWKTGKPIAEYNLVTGKPNGYTLYLGNRESEILCRFYDKRAKEKKKYENNFMELPDHWIRCELELHRERAHNFAFLFCSRDNYNIGNLFMGVLNNYMRVTDAGLDLNRARWENCEMWKRFINSVEKLSLSNRKPDRKIDDVYQWVSKSVSPSLFLLFSASHGDIDLLHNLIKQGSLRQSKKHLMMLSEYRKLEEENPIQKVDKIHDIKEALVNLDWQEAEKGTLPKTETYEEIKLEV